MKNKRNRLDSFLCYLSTKEEEIQSVARFLKFILDLTIFCVCYSVIWEQLSVNWVTFSSTPGLYPRDIRSTSHSLVITIKNTSRHCPQLRTTGQQYRIIDSNFFFPQHIPSVKKKIIILIIHLYLGIFMYKLHTWTIVLIYIVKYK